MSEEVGQLPQETKKVGRPPKAKDPFAGRSRRKRGQLGRRSQMDVTAKPGYHQRWVNDTPGRIEQMREAGYELLLDDDNKAKTMRVGRSPDGGALTAHLMYTPQDWYDESRQESQGLVIDPADMKEAQVGEGEYLPDGKKSALTSKLR